MLISQLKTAKGMWRFIEISVIIQTTPLTIYNPIETSSIEPPIAVHLAVVLADNDVDVVFAEDLSTALIKGEATGALMADLGGGNANLLEGLQLVIMIVLQKNRISLCFDSFSGRNMGYLHRCTSR
jgi:hypothetical protein